jgi:sugar phosphate isomerase/epimerase
MPKLAAFPKAFMQALCKEGTMTVSEWIQLASKLDVQGLEWYAGFLEMADESNWPRFRQEVEDTGKVIPMMCCSPDFTHPDAAFREKEIGKQKRWIDMTHTLGGSYCRVLSGQRRPELTLDEGVKARRGLDLRLPALCAGARHHADHRKPLQGRLLGVSRVRAEDGCLLQTRRCREPPELRRELRPLKHLPRR